MASKASEPAKLLAVTLIRSHIRAPHSKRRTLEALGLTKRYKTVIHKNTQSVTGHLLTVKEHILVRPVVVRTDVENSPTGEEFYGQDGFFFMDTRPDKPANEPSE